MKTLKSHHFFLNYFKDEKKADSHSLKVLLKNHPFDCPICPRNGGCSIQTLVEIFKPPLAHFEMSNFPISSLDPSPFITYNLERCIKCMQCVEFRNDLTTADDSNHSPEEQIVSALNDLQTTILAGNAIDLCPSGALNPFPFGPKYSSWEVLHHPSIDTMNGEGVNITIEYVGNTITGILPRWNEEINQEWISDKTRFSYDGFLKNRIDQPYIRSDGKLTAVSWSEAFKFIVRKMSALKAPEMAALAGDLMEVESIYLLRQLLDSLHIYNRDCLWDKAFIPTTYRQNYLFNTPFHKLEESDACLIVGCNTALDAPLLHRRLIHGSKKGHLKVASLGKIDMPENFYSYLGDEITSLRSILKGNEKFSKIFSKAKKPMIILGTTVLQGPQGSDWYEICWEIAHKYNLFKKNWNGFNIVHLAANRVGALDVGFIPAPNAFGTLEILQNARAGKIKFLYLLGVDEIDPRDFGKAFIVYQGTHWDQGAAKAEVILPGSTSLEKNGFYVNMEGRAQRAFKLQSPPGIAKEDWKIIRAFSEVIGHTLPYNTHESIIQDLKCNFPQFHYAGCLIPSHLPPPIGRENNRVREEGREPYKVISSTRKSYYLTNPICRASHAMRRASMDIILAPPKPRP